MKITEIVRPAPIVTLALMVWIFGFMSAWAGQYGYYRELMRVWYIPIPDASKEWIVVCGICSVGVFIGIGLLYAHSFKYIAKCKCNSDRTLIGGFLFSFFTVPLLAFGIGTTTAFAVQNRVKVEVVDVNFGSVTQIATFYRHEHGALVGVVVDRNSHKLTTDVFELPVTNGKMNANPSRIQIENYSQLK